MARPTQPLAKPVEDYLDLSFTAGGWVLPMPTEVEEIFDDLHEAVRQRARDRLTALRNTRRLLGLPDVETEEE